MGGQARQLEREVDPRNRPVLIAVDQRDFRGLLQGTGEPADQVQAGLLVKIGLGLADHRLAQQVGREGQRLVAQAQDRPGGLVGRGAGDEFPRHHPGSRACRPGQQCFAIRTGRSQGDRQFQPPGHAVAGLRQVLRQVPPHRIGRSERGQGVDEPEKLDPNLGIVQSPGHEPVVPPGAMPRRGPAADPFEKLTADLPGFPLERLGIERPRDGACTQARHA